MVRYAIGGGNMYFIAAGILGLFLLVYLGYVVFNPEKF